MDLFSPLQIRDVTLRNRIAVSPMCQYSSQDGLASDWHLVHLGSRAVGGAGLVMIEATAIEPRGRISPADMGLWSDAHTQAFRPITTFIKDQGAVAGIQLAHAGRKGSSQPPWVGQGSQIAVGEGGWETVAPSAIPFVESDRRPKELTIYEINKIAGLFVQAAERALHAGFEVVEIHAAHGYLLHEFLSPLTNKRTDEYGGSLDNRARLLREVVSTVRSVWPERLPLLVRLSATDWVEGGWTVDDSVKLAVQLKPMGVDLIDCSSGAIAPNVAIPIAPGFQVPLSEKIRYEAKILTGAVGMITEPEHANEIICQGKADLVLLARELLRDPYWPLHAARKLKASMHPPVQYQRAF